MSNRLRHHFRLVVLCLVGTLITPGQQDPPTFRTSTTLVEFTMVVQDGKGGPITDLKKEEVSILENDQPRQAAVFRFSGATQDGSRPQPLPAGVFSNRSDDAPNASRNFVAIVLDAMNTPLTHKDKNQAIMHGQMQRYLQRLPPDTRAASFLLGYNVKMLHDFTDDIEALRASMKKTDMNLPPQVAKGDNPTASGSPEGASARAEMAAWEARMLSIYNERIHDRRLAITLAGLEALGNQLAGLPGRKSLMWASFGIPMRIQSDGFPKSYGGPIEKTARRLASQGIAIYSVWDDGPVMQMLSRITGGRVVQSLNDPAKGVTVATADQSGVYSLGFYTGEPDGQWHSLKVKVNRPGAGILYQQGYMSVAPAARPQEWAADQWRIAATRPLGSSVIHLDAHVQIVSGALHTTLLIAADDLHFRNEASEVEIAIAERTADGLSDLRRVNGSIRLPESGPGKGKGAYGSVDLPVRQIPPAEGPVVDKL